VIINSSVVATHVNYEDDLGMLSYSCLHINFSTRVY